MSSEPVDADCTLLDETEVNVKYRSLGQSALTVSRLSMGTVELAQVYGIQSKLHAGRPDRQTSVDLLEGAYASGINLFDTAPSYGCSEEMLGDVFARREELLIATKINIPPADGDPSLLVRQSIESSLTKLRRDRLDIVKIHNATKDTFERKGLTEALIAAKKNGEVHLTGASVYGPEDALAALRSGVVDVIQVAYNILDQRMDDGVLRTAKDNGIGVISRSVYLKGVLTDRAVHLPERCRTLREAAERAMKTLDLRSWSDLSRMALRFALSNEMIDSVLVGISSQSELDFALRCEEEGPLEEDALERARSCGIDDPHWLDPSNWGVP